jgi:hypothetical protein
MCLASSLFSSIFQRTPALTIAPVTGSAAGTWTRQYALVVDAAAGQLLLVGAAAYQQLMGEPLGRHLFGQGDLEPGPVVGTLPLGALALAAALPLLARCGVVQQVTGRRGLRQVRLAQDLEPAA